MQWVLFDVSYNVFMSSGHGRSWHFPMVFPFACRLVGLPTQVGDVARFLVFVLTSASAAFPPKLWFVEDFSFLDELFSSDIWHWPNMLAV